MRLILETWRHLYMGDVFLFADVASDTVSAVFVCQNQDPWTLLLPDISGWCQGQRLEYSWRPGQVGGDENWLYRKTSNISCTLVSNKIVDNSDVVGASPVGAAPTTSSFST